MLGDSDDDCGNVPLWCSSVSTCSFSGTYILTKVSLINKTKTFLLCSFHTEPNVSNLPEENTDSAALRSSTDNLMDSSALS